MSRRRRGAGNRGTTPCVFSTELLLGSHGGHRTGRSAWLWNTSTPSGTPSVVGSTSGGPSAHRRACAIRTVITEAAAFSAYRRVPMRRKYRRHGYPWRRGLPSCGVRSPETPTTARQARLRPVPYRSSRSRDPGCAGRPRHRCSSSTRRRSTGQAPRLVGERLPMTVSTRRSRCCFAVDARGLACVPDRNRHPQRAASTPARRVCRRPPIRCPPVPCVSW